jgi:hypothetical protein
MMTTTTTTNRNSSSNIAMTQDTEMAMQLGQRLYDWSVSMGFKPSGRYAGRRIPPVDAYARLCRGNLVPVWNFIVSHVMSIHDVAHIRSNLVANRVLLPTIATESVTNSEHSTSTNKATSVKTSTRSTATDLSLSGASVPLRAMEVVSESEAVKRKQLEERLAKARRELLEVQGALQRQPGSASPLQLDLQAMKASLHQAGIRTHPQCKHTMRCDVA